MFDFSLLDKYFRVPELFKDFTEKGHLELCRSVRTCPRIDIDNEDSIEVSGWEITVHEGGRASRVKGKITMTPWQWRRLLRAILEADGDEVKDYSCVDLRWLVEGD